MTPSRSPGRVARPRALVTTLALSAILVGCAGSGASGARAPRASRDRIVAEEMASLQQLDALEVVQRLRPNWLRIRGGRLPQVILDGTPIEGGMDTLRTYRVGEIKELRYLDPADATLRFGTGFPAGAILIITGR